MPGWNNYRKLVEEEFNQSIEEGKEIAAVDALRSEFAAAGDDARRLEAILGKLMALPMRVDFPFVEPNDLPGIRAQRAQGTRRAAIKLPAEALYDRMYGAWLGRCCGCALGKPVERFMGPYEGLSSRQRIRTYLTALGPTEWPLNNYFPEHSPAEEKTGKAGCVDSTREHIAFMETDDDIRYTVIGQIVMRESGRDFTTWDVAKTWLRLLPYGQVCTAETQAYRNLVIWGEMQMRLWGKGTADPDWDWVATNLNPFREWIGADIRVDSWGYAAPDNPELAAEFAWRDARLSHVKNGIYGAMFMAAMIAAAFGTDDPMAIVEAGLKEIPQRSRLAVEMRQAIEICRHHGFDAGQFEAVLDDIEKLLGHYNAVHTNNNAAVVVASLLLGKHDFEKVITIAVMGGWDSDCNGATAGSIAGAMLGARRLPDKWTAPLHDTLNSLIAGYHPIAISECAQRSVEIAQKVQA